MNGNNTQRGSAPKRLRILQLNLDKIHIASSSLLGFLESSTLKYSIISLQESQNFSQCPANYSLFPPRHFYRKLQNNKKPRASLGKTQHGSPKPSHFPYHNILNQSKSKPPHQNQTKSFAKTARKPNPTVINEPSIQEFFSKIEQQLSQFFDMIKYSTTQDTDENFLTQFPHFNKESKP